MIGTLNYETYVFVNSLGPDFSFRTLVFEINDSGHVLPLYLLDIRFFGLRSLFQLFFRFILCEIDISFGHMMAPTQPPFCSFSLRQRAEVMVGGADLLYLYDK
jgi:hypothetical protein